MVIHTSVLHMLCTMHIAICLVFTVNLLQSHVTTVNNVKDPKCHILAFVVYVLNLMTISAVQGLEDASLFGCYAVSLGKYFRTFRSIVVASSSGLRRPGEPLRGLLGLDVPLVSYFTLSLYVSYAVRSLSCLEILRHLLLFT